jgi:hypothetical protein
MADESSQGPASKKRNRETTESRSTQFWGADSAWHGGTLAKAAHQACQVCSSCQTLLIRPTCDPNTQKGITSSDPRSMVRRSLSGISSVAMNGCIICKLVITAQTTTSQRKMTVDRLYSFQLALYWYPSIIQFDQIDMAPVDNISGITFNRDSIKLVLEDSTILKKKTPR